MDKSVPNYSLLTQDPGDHNQTAVAPSMEPLFVIDSNQSCVDLLQSWTRFSFFQNLNEFKRNYIMDLRLVKNSSNNYFECQKFLECHVVFWWYHNASSPSRLLCSERQCRSIGFALFGQQYNGAGLAACWILKIHPIVLCKGLGCLQHQKDFCTFKYGKNSSSLHVASTSIFNREDSQGWTSKLVNVYTRMCGVGGF